VKVHYVKSIDLQGLAKKAGADFQSEELDKILRTEEALQDLAGLITRNHRPGAKGIVFAHSVKQACLLRDLLVDRHSVACSVVHSYQSHEEYDSELKAFTVGDRELIINVGCLTTGWDYPPLSEIFLAKPTKALNKYTQMVGRGTRTLAGVIDGLATAEERKAAIAASAKPSFVIHDITDSSRCHKLCSALDVLSEQTGTAKAKVTQQLEEEEVGLEEIDKAVADEMEAERQQAKLHREAERKRRERLVVGVEWDSEDRDPFADPDREDARRREWRCPFGKKWRGQPMKVVDQGWIEWALREAKLTPMWRKVFTEELDRRKNAARFETPSQAQFRRQLEEGRRYAAKVRASDGE
jgi:superfamily II DNA or RNA helicase